MKAFLKRLQSIYTEIPVIARRLYILFFMVVFLFTVLVIRLADMQLVNADFYLEKLRKTTIYEVSTSTERGQIYDVKGTPLVQNVSKK